MIEKHLYEILSTLVAAAIYLGLFIFRKEVKRQDDRHALLLVAVNENKQRSEKQDSVIEEVKDSQREIQLNYNEKFLGIHKELARIEIALKNDMSATRHTLNNNINRMLGVVSELKDHINDKFVTLQQCDAFHKQSEIEIKNLKEQIRRKAV